MEMRIKSQPASGPATWGAVNAYFSSALALHFLQASLVYVNTRMSQTVLTEPAWEGRTPPVKAVLLAKAEDCRS
ncbi:MAG: hypothetical protein EP345_05840 [Sphingomonadales bacterium]|nr:MAG: hypothetical protein EP345_05840 [Sphingomonadales bacterium]